MHLYIDIEFFPVFGADTEFLLINRNFFAVHMIKTSFILF
jgi:hypothetical protein